MVYATFDDVAVKYEQPLTTAQQPRVEQILADLSDNLDELVPTLAARVETDARLARTARRIVVDAAIRTMDNPKGYLGESAGDVSYYYGVTGMQDRPTPGRPFLEGELRLLRPAGRRKVGTIRARVPGDSTCEASRVPDASPPLVWP